MTKMNRIRVLVELDGEQVIDINEEVNTAEVNVSLPVTEMPSVGMQRMWGHTGDRSITISTYDAKRDDLLHLGREKKL